MLFYWNPSLWKHEWEKPDKLIMAQLKANTIELEVTCTKDELEAELFKLRETHERENDEGRKALDAERRKRNLKLQQRLKIKATAKKSKSKRKGRGRLRQQQTNAKAEKAGEGSGSSKGRVHKPNGNKAREQGRSEDAKGSASIVDAGVAAAQATLAAIEASCPWAEYFDETSGAPYYVNDENGISQCAFRGWCSVVWCGVVVGGGGGVGERAGETQSKTQSETEMQEEA